MSPVPDPSQNHEGNPLDGFSSEIHGLGLNGAGSSSEEEDASAFEFAEYQPLSQGPDLEEDSIDYSSVSGLMSALNAHGPTEVSVEEISPRANNSAAVKNSEINSADTCDPSEALAAEAEKERKAADTREQASLWNSQNNATSIEIDKNKEDEIKSVMSKITLPTSAIPQWAREISDEQWKTQISSRIFGNTNS